MSNESREKLVGTRLTPAEMNANPATPITLQGVPDAKILGWYLSGSGASEKGPKVVVNTEKGKFEDVRPDITGNPPYEVAELPTLEELQAFVNHDPRYYFNIKAQRIERMR